MKISLLDELLNSPRAITTTLLGVAIILIASIPAYYGLQPALSKYMPEVPPLTLSVLALCVVFIMILIAFTGHSLQRNWVKVTGHVLNFMFMGFALIMGSLIASSDATNTVAIENNASAYVAQLETQLANKEGIEAQALGSPATAKAHAEFLALSDRSKTSKGAPIWNVTSDCMRPGSYITACASLQSAHDKVRAAQRVATAEITASLNAELTKARQGVVKTIAGPEATNKLAIAAQRFITDPGTLLAVDVLGGLVLAISFELLIYTALFVITLSPASDGPAEPQHFDIEPLVPVSQAQQPQSQPDSLLGFDQDWFVAHEFSPQGASLAAKLFAEGYASGLAIPKRTTQAKLGVGREKLLKEVLDPLVACGLVEKNGDDYTWALKSAVEGLD